MSVDAIAGSWAAIEGTEFVNNTRTTAYLKAGFGPPALQVLSDCECSEEVLRPLIGCDTLPYSTPAADNAPWFDPLQPESAMFSGFYMTDFTGYDSTYKRDVFPLITGGGVLGRLVPGPRTMKWSGFLFGKTCCSVAFGLKWLTSVLRQGRCGSECFGEQMDLLWCCPQASTSPWEWCEELGSWVANVGPTPADYIYPALGNTPDYSSLLVPLDGGIPNNGTINIFSRNNTTACSAEEPIDVVVYEDPDSIPGWCCGANGLYPAGTNLFVRTSGPTFTRAGDPPPNWDPRSIFSDTISYLPLDACLGIDNTDAFRTALRVGLLDGPHVKSVRRSSGCGCGCSAIMEVEFSIIAGNPYFYRSPLTLANAVPFGVIDCPEWIKVPPGICPPVPVCPDPVPCTVDSRFDCVPIAPPVIPQFVDPCACDPLAPTKFCTNFLAANVEAMFNGEPIFQIYSGSAAIRNAQIQIYANPQGLNCADVISDACNACTTISIRFIPANATLTIDSTLKRITIECAGGSLQPGEPFLTGTFEWPVFECIDYCICVQVDGISVAPDATYSIDVWPREF